MNQMKTKTVVITFAKRIHQAWWKLKCRLLCLDS